MSNEYFKNFPKMEYKGYQIRNIMRSSKIVETWENSPYMFLPLTIEDGETAEDIAHHYYGDANLDWLIYIANGMQNPYTDWVMSSRVLDTYIANKYRSQAGSPVEDIEVIRWTTQNVAFYTNDFEDRITPLSYEMMDNDERDNWSSVSYYDYEVWLNEHKRHIRVINAAYAPTAVKQFESSLND